MFERAGGLNQRIDPHIAGKYSLGSLLNGCVPQR